VSLLVSFGTASNAEREASLTLLVLSMVEACVTTSSAVEWIYRTLWHAVFQVWSGQASQTLPDGSLGFCKLAHRPFFCEAHRFWQKAMTERFISSHRLANKCDEKSNKTSGKRIREKQSNYQVWIVFLFNAVTNEKWWFYCQNQPWQWHLVPQRLDDKVSQVACRLLLRLPLPKYRRQLLEELRSFREWGGQCPT